MKIKNIELKKVAVEKGGFPQSAISEIAFIGRSNVGKSSLINCLTERKSLARTSSAPGKTRTINFYETTILENEVEKTLFLVDLPGYGYAKISKAEKEKFGQMMDDYLLHRPNLKVMIHLIDIRIEPTADDRQMSEWFSYYNYEVLTVATKSDKIKRSQLQKQLKILAEALNIHSESIIPFSAQTKAGRQELWQRINQFI